MSKTLQGFRFAVQIHPAKGSADVNITAGRVHSLAFAKLHKLRNDIHSQVQKDLEWRLNNSGESWVLVRHPFQLSSRNEWNVVYDWLIENLTIFLQVFLPRIESIRKRLEES